MYSNLWDTKRFWNMSWKDLVFASTKDHLTYLLERKKREALILISWSV